MNIVLKNIAKKMAYVIAAVIILIALLVCVSRMLVPILDKRLPDFETWATQTLGTPVKIKKVRVAWYQYQPEITLDDVTVLGKESNKPVLQIEAIRVFFSLPKSLWQRKPVLSRVMLAGSDITIVQSPAGTLSVLGFPDLGGFSNAPYQEQSKFTDVMGWILTQPHLILHDIDVKYTGKNNIKRFITLYNLSIENDGDHHNVYGKAILHQDIPTEATVAIQCIGTEPDINKIKARAYLYVSGLSLSEWWKGLTWNHWQLQEGVVSAKIWASWSQGEFKKIQSTFELYHADLFSTVDNSHHRIPRLSGDVGWKRDGNNQIFAGDNILIDLPNHLWPVSSFYVSLTPDAKNQFIPQAINLGYIDLADVQSFLFSSQPILTEVQQDLLKELQIKGSIENISAVFNDGIIDWHHAQLNLNFNHLSIAPYQSYPGIAELSGLVKWNGTDGDLQLQSNQTQLTYTSIFTDPLLMDQITGTVQFKQDADKNWVLHIPELHLLNSDLAMNVQGDFTIHEKSAPVANLSANFTMPKAARITRYLPLKIWSKDLDTWLLAAFSSGQVEAGTAALRGKVTDFPFDKNNGTFQISGTVKNVDLHYASDWPNLHNINGKLNFTGARMMVDVDQAQMLDIPIGKVHGEIPNLSADNPQLLIKSEPIHTDFANGMRFVHASPLEKNIGKMFTDVAVHGPIDLTLGLTVPLSNPDNTKVSGDIQFNRADMNMVPWQLQVKNLTGQLHFTETDTNAKGIKGDIFGKPLLLTIATIQKSKTVSYVRAGIETTLAITDLEDWLKVSLSKYAKGDALVKGNIDFSLTEPMNVHLQSDLNGIAIDLPEPYAKKSDEKRDFSADITVEEGEPLTLITRYNNILGAALVLDKKASKFNLISATLRIGGGEPTISDQPGLFITGSFAQLDWDKIKDYAAQSGAALGESSENTPHSETPIANLPLKNVSIAVKSLDVFGLHLAQVNLSVTPVQNTWQVDINSPEVVGRITLPTKFLRQNSIDAQFKKLILHSSATTQKTPEIDVKDLPSISVFSDYVNYNNRSLGQLTFKSAPASNGMTIKTLQIISRYINVQTSGVWIANGPRYQTNLKGNGTSTNFSGFLNGLGFDAHNLVASTGKFDFNLTWNDAPFSPDVASMNGSAYLNLGAGRIVDIGETSGAKMDLGRMLSIFSLQTIPRRLSLDFSDIFQKGYSFDYVKGDYKITNGNVYTTNMRIDGPVAKVDIAGRIGLVAKDYDMTLSVTANVTSSLPVAATLLTGQPLIGIAAFAVNTMVGSEVSKATTYYYTVRGPWSNPAWTSVSGGKR